jgi:hypothetical protein
MFDTIPPLSLHQSQIKGATIKSQLQTILSARNLYMRLVELKDYLLDQLKPVGADGESRDCVVRLFTFHGGGGEREEAGRSPERT